MDEVRGMSAALLRGGGTTLRCRGRGERNRWSRRSWSRRSGGRFVSSRFVCRGLVSSRFVGTGFVRNRLIRLCLRNCLSFCLHLVAHPDQECRDAFADRCIAAHHQTRDALIERCRQLHDRVLRIRRDLDQDVGRVSCAKHHRYRQGSSDRSRASGRKQNLHAENLSLESAEARWNLCFSAAYRPAVSTLSFGFIAGAGATFSASAFGAAGGG
jgi:hypothetical protein